MEGLTDAGRLRATPYMSGLTTVGSLRRRRKVFRNWILMTVLLHASRPTILKHLALPLARSLSDLKFTLKTRSGISIRLRSRDLWSPFEVFGLGEYDFKFVRWSDLATV